MQGLRTLVYPPPANSCSPIYFAYHPRRIALAFCQAECEFCSRSGAKLYSPEPRLIAL